MPTHYDGTEDEERALNTFIRFTRAFDTVDRKISTIFQTHDLTSGQFGVLETLYHLGPLHQGALGDKLLQSKGNISTIITNLEERNLVERRRDPEDRRYVQVHLTDEGRTLIADIFPDHVQQIADTFGVLTDEEIEELGRLCKKLGVRNAEK
jgi:MarR family 2-MHQ and catechol resistance regulon transcriptional repressor